MITKSVLLVLAALAAPVVAQNTDHATLKPAEHAKLQPRKQHQPKRIAHGQPTHRAAAAKNVSQQHHPAKLKTSQLTTRQAAHLETKKTALHHQTHGNREQDRRLTPKDEETSQIHLKQHNARTF